MNNDCKGCFTNSYVNAADRGYHGCIYSECNDTGQCPCGTCIIKPMCRKACEDYEIFTESTYKVIGYDC
jgi:hypothetical protein